MKRSFQVSLGILVVLGIAAYLVMQRPGEISRSAEADDVLVKIDSMAVNKLEITSETGEVTLEKQAGRWMLVNPIKYPADENTVASALAQAKSINLKGLVSSNPDKQSLFKVDSTATLVKVYEKGSESAAFRVGKPSSTFSETYVRLDNSNDVYLAEGILSSVFSRQPKEWRDKTIYKTDQTGITEVKLQHGDTTVNLAFRDSLWFVDRDSAVQSNVTSFLSSLSNFQADEFIDSAITRLPKLTATIDVLGSQIRFYYNKDASKYYVQTSGSAQWFEIQPWRASQVLKRKKDFLPAKPT